MTRPLSGIRVLDASTFLAGPLCCSLLADWGADVVKVEPAGGDPARTLGGPQLAPGMSPVFVAGNRGKRAIALDYGAAEGRDLVARLAGACDLVVHNQRAEVASRLGLSAVPAIVCSLSAFGALGPYAGLPALDSMIQAMTGMSSLTGEPGGVPMRAGPQVIDVGAGMAAAGACAAALLGRERTGAADDVAIALYDVGLLFNASFVALRSACGQTPPRLGNRSHPLLADQFAARDGFVVVAVWDEPRWHALCQVLGLDDLLADEGLASNDGRLAGYATIQPALAEAISAWTGSDLTDALHARGVLCCVTLDLDDVAADLHARESGAIYSESRLGDRVDVVAGPVQFGGKRAVAPDRCPLLGEHSAAILGDWLALSPSAVSSIVERRIVVTRTTT